MNGLRSVVKNNWSFERIDMKHAKLITMILVVAALTPWVIGAIDVVTSDIGKSSIDSSSYDVLFRNVQSKFDWKIYWHIAMLLVFISALLLTEKIPFSRKFSWLFGLVFFWPIVSIFFICRVVLGHEPDESPAQ